MKAILVVMSLLANGDTAETRTEFPSMADCITAARQATGDRSEGVTLFVSRDGKRVAFCGRM